MTCTSSDRAQNPLGGDREETPRDLEESSVLALNPPLL